MTPSGTIRTTIGAALAGAALLVPAAAPARAEDPADPMYGAAPTPAAAVPVPPAPAATPRPRVRRPVRATRPRRTTTPAPAAIASAPTRTRAWTARVLLSVPLRGAPKTSAPRRGMLSPYAPHDGGPQSLLVLAARASRADGVWYRVLLPSRPNGAAAWVPASAVKVTPTAYRVEVRLGRRRAALLRAGRTVASWPVGVGTPANPTPQGRFAVSEVIRQPDASGFYGPYILTLTAHSTTLSDFDGGGGRVALHGTSRPDLLGQAVSHGCVRMPNAAIRVIARAAPPGAPVDILP